MEGFERISSCRHRIDVPEARGTIHRESQRGSSLERVDIEGFEKRSSVTGSDGGALQQETQIVAFVGAPGSMRGAALARVDMDGFERRLSRCKVALQQEKQIMVFGAPRSIYERSCARISRHEEIQEDIRRGRCKVAAYQEAQIETLFGAP
jgi:hypothetical protein